MPTALAPIGFSARKAHAHFGMLSEQEAIAFGLYRPIGFTGSNPAVYVPFETRYPAAWFSGFQAALGPSQWAFLQRVVDSNPQFKTPAPDPNPAYGAAALPATYPPALTLKVAIPAPDGYGVNGTGWMWAP